MVIVFECLLVGKLGVNLYGRLLGGLLLRLMRPHAFLLPLGGEVSPLEEEAVDRAYPVVGVEEGGHRVQ